MSKFGTFLLDTLQVLVFAISIFLFVYLLLVQPHRIKGDSMVPNFIDGEFLLTDKVSYRFGDPQRGDVIVFKAPPDDKEEFIKRVIGLPGDTIMVQNGSVYVNGSKLNESYLDPSIVSRSRTFATEGKQLTVPANHYFVMGDNRDHSFDSRDLGFIDRSKFIGKALVVYWPPAEAGLVPHATY